MRISTYSGIVENDLEVFVTGFRFFGIVSVFAAGIMRSRDNPGVGEKLFLCGETREITDLQINGKGINLTNTWYPEDSMDILIEDE